MIKKLVDVLVCYVSDSDVVGRLAKINNKLSISYNLLVNNLNNMLSKNTFFDGALTGSFAIVIVIEWRDCLGSPLGWQSHLERTT